MLGVSEQQQGAVAAKDCATVERVIQKVRITNLVHLYPTASGCECIAFLHVQTIQELQGLRQQLLRANDTASAAKILRKAEDDLTYQTKVRRGSAPWVLLHHMHSFGPETSRNCCLRSFSTFSSQA